MRYSDEDLRRLKARRRELVREYGDKGQRHPMGRMIGGLNPAAQELHRLRGQINEAEHERRGPAPRLTEIPGTKSHYGLKFDIDWQGRHGKLGTDNFGRWYVVVGEGREAQALEDENGHVAHFKTKGEAAKAFARLSRTPQRDARRRSRTPRRDRVRHAHATEAAHLGLSGLTEGQKSIARREVRAAARESLRTGENWQVNALYRLRERGFSTKQAQSLVRLAERRFST